jgi:hypothetical protein
MTKVLWLEQPKRTISKIETIGVADILLFQLDSFLETSKINHLIKYFISTIFVFQLLTIKIKNMATILNIIWNIDNQVDRGTVIEVSENEKELLLAKYEGTQFPKYCEVKDGHRYGVHIETKKADVKEAKVSKKEVEEAPVEAIEEEKEIVTQKKTTFFSKAEADAAKAK